MALRLKLIFAVVLVTSAALPQYTCVSYVAPDGGRWQVIPEGADSTRYRREVERHYAFESFRPGQPESWLTVLCFAWPAAVLAVGSRFRSGRLKTLVWWLEPLLAVGSGFLILVFSDFGQRAIGAYLGAGANAALLAIWIVQLGSRFRARPQP